jgi:phosphate transport system substrate-binding protein
VIAALALAACGSSNPAPAGQSGSPASSIDCQPGSLTGEGSTAQANAIQQWIADYQTKCGSGTTIAYNTTGSGAGRGRFIGAQVDFAGSDAAMSATEAPQAQARCAGNPAWNLPMVVGPIAVAYNLSGAKDIILTPSLISQIFLGTITTWNDQQIKDANPGASLPAQGIKVFFRSDDSGTTQNFTSYLHAAAPADWTADGAQKWAGSVGEGRKGSDGVQQAVSSTPGGIGYMEYSFADNAGLPSARVDNGGGPVTLTPATASTAINSAQITGAGNDLSLSIDYATTAAGAYPIVLATYEIVCSQGLAAPSAALLKSFLTYTAGAGQDGLAGLGYAPLPASIKAKVQAAIAELG